MHLTLDLELYEPLRADPSFMREQARVTDRVREALAGSGIRVTCFVTGEFAQSYPDLVMAFVRDGHEIGSHTMNHVHYNDVGPKAFGEDIEASTAALKRLTGRAPVGFRAPLGQIPDDAPRLLASQGFRYDSSIAATRIPGHFNGLRTPRRVYQASLDDLRQEAPGSGFWEVPVSVTPWIPIPCGGIFLPFLVPAIRALPALRRDPFVMYLHPYDFMDLKRQRGAKPWDRVKWTRNNWRILDLVQRHGEGRDLRLLGLIPESDGGHWKTTPNVAKPTLIGSTG